MIVDPLKVDDNEDDPDAQLDQKNYATVALCCLSVTNPFRNKVIQMVTVNPCFDRIILVVIFFNCIILALDNEAKWVSENSKMIDMILLIIFSIEMSLKVIAMGFVTREHSYLRDTWNVLDFFVVVMGWIGTLFTTADVTAIRVIRILRPLRTIN